MKWYRRVSLFAAIAFGVPTFCPLAAEPNQSSGEKIRVLVVTGGHDFEHEQFFKIFSGNADFTFKPVEHPNAHRELTAEAATNYDVLVAYDMHQEISEAAKADLLSWLKQGKGLVVLHHAIASYQKWPEYSKIIGARYYLEKTTVDGVEKARSIYQHDLHFTIHVADPNHPVTRGVEDFQIHDETYNLFDVASDVHPLLTASDPHSNKVIGWAKMYGPARVVYLQSGHDHFAYENPHYQKIVKQAIRWTAHRE